MRELFAKWPIGVSVVKIIHTRGFVDELLQLVTKKKIDRM